MEKEDLIEKIDQLMQERCDEGQLTLIYAFIQGITEK